MDGHRTEEEAWREINEGLGSHSSLSSRYACETRETRRQGGIRAVACAAVPYFSKAEYWRSLAHHRTDEDSIILESVENNKNNI